MAQSFLQTSFAAGELSPALNARVDMAKYRVGAALLRNTYVDVRGGVSNRPGTSFVGRSMQTNSVGVDGCGGIAPRLIPFTFSTVQTYALEFGNLYMRVITQGGYVLEAAKTITAITQANPGVVTSAAHGFVNGDWVFITGVIGMTQVNGQTYIVATAAANTFALHDLDGNAVNTTTFTAYSSGGTASRIFTLTTPYAIGDIALLKYAQSADVLTITHPSYPPADITRTGNAAWTYTPITFGPNINPPINVAVVTDGGSGLTVYRYVVTAVSQTTAEESRASLVVSVTGQTMSTSPGVKNSLTWSPVAGAGYYNVYRQPEVYHGGADLGQVYGFIGTTNGVSLSDQNISPDFTRTPPQARNPFANSPILYWVISNGGSGYTTGNTATVTDGTGTLWAGFVEAVGGAITAIITQNQGQNYTLPSITVAGGSGLVATATLGPATGNYPGCVTYFQQRKVFAASINNPETFWMTQIGNYKNMDVSVPTRDSDAITATISSLQVNAIKFLVPMASGLIIGSSSGAWQVSGGTVGEPVTPSNIVASPQAFNGSSDVPPITVNYDILFVQNKSNVVRDLTYNFYVNNYTGADMTVLANHLFYGFEILEWAYQDEPTKIVWAIRNDGTLLSFSYLKEQEVYAWAHHDTEGTFQSVVTISEGEEDAVYFITRRTIPGQHGGLPVFYLERMASRQLSRPWTDYLANVTNAWFVDCGLQYEFVTPDACATLSGPASIAITTDVAVFNSGSVGSVIRINGGVGTITALTSSTQATVSFITAPGSQNQALEGDWTLTTPVTTVTGLDHLDGSSVTVLSNGSVEGPYTVVNGAITLQQASDIVTVGLPYIAQGTTMYLDVGQPTISGKRKTIPALTALVENSRGLSFSSQGFDDLSEVKERTTEPMGQPTELTTGEERINVYGAWDTFGQVYWEEAYPLPYTILGIVSESTIGDTTGRAG